MTRRVVSLDNGSHTREDFSWRRVAPSGRASFVVSDLEHTHHSDSRLPRLSDDTHPNVRSLSAHDWAQHQQIQGTRHRIARDKADV